MVKLTVLYGHPTDPDAFEKYYAEIHVPLALKIPGLVRFEAGKAVGSPTGAPAYFFLAELWFESRQHLEAASNTPEGKAATADVANFATGGVTMLVGEISTAEGHL
jgi:uncharacterized protein (TIGR02118 family)